MQIHIPKVNDFDVTGKGDQRAWERSDWIPLTRVGHSGGPKYLTRAKVVHSSTGIYFLLDCEDRRLTCTMTQDFENIFTEDVVEVFLWPDQKQSLYFEYELSPLDVELPILIPNHRGYFHGWRPWHFEGPRRTRHATSVRGGKRKSMAKVEGWTAEFFIPFKLLVGLGNNPPKRGTKWRANFYRIDYDARRAAHWAWCHHTGPNFHLYEEFGTIVFD